MCRAGSRAEKSAGLLKERGGVEMLNQLANRSWSAGNKRQS